MIKENLTRSLTALLLFGAIALALLEPSTQGFAAESTWSKGWDKLASRTVRLSSEQDEIPLTHKGKIQKLVFEVRKASVNFKDVKVHLVSGAVLDIPVRSFINEGERTRVIDLPGEAKTVRKIVFTYSTTGLKRAEVIVWGKKN